VDVRPLTASGKLDRRELAVSVERDRQQTGAPAPVSGNPVLDAVVALMSDAIGVALAPDDRFFDAGGNSLLAVGLFTAIEERFGAQVPLTALAAPDLCARHLAALVDEAIEHGRRFVPALTCPADDGHRDGPGLHCVHAWLGGVSFYEFLAKALHPTHPVYGLYAHQDVAPSTTDLATTIEEMALRVAGQIGELQPEGPYRLLGHSLGGLIALEVGRRLAESDVVESVTLVDTWCRTSRRVGLRTRAGFAVNRLIGRSEEIDQVNMEAEYRHLAATYRGRVALLTTADSRSSHGRHDLGWGRLLPNLELHEIPGDHLMLFRDEASATAIADVLVRHRLAS
jgi:thioesterase domain-containing protein/acyl carrier protein